MDIKLKDCIDQRKLLTCNSFEPAGGGMAGTVSTTVGQLGTFSSPDVSQNPASFDSSTKNRGTPATEFRPSASFDKDIDHLFTKAETPTPDEVLCGLQFELGNMVHKDKKIAKETVITNLKSNPRYYSDLHMLGIKENKRDKIMENVSSKQIAATKKVLDQMIEERKKKYDFIPEVKKILDDKLAEKKKRNEWFPSN